MEIPDKGPLHAPVAGEGPVEGLQQSQQTDPEEETDNDIGSDTVRLTDKGRDFNSAVDQARTLPDVRMDRVMQLKRQLAQGTYRVEGSRIAVNMMDESMENDSVLKHIDTKA